MRYCIDANFFIHLWRSYLSPEISSSFWDWLDELFGKGIIFVPEEVFYIYVNNMQAINLVIT